MECSIENVFLKISQIHRKTPVLKSLFNKVTDTLLATLTEGESNTSAFLWISQKKLRTPDDCLWETSYLNWYVKRLFMVVVSFPIQYIKKIAHEISFSRVCKINLQRSVISRHRINRYPANCSPFRESNVFFRPSSKNFNIT